MNEYHKSPGLHVVTFYAQVHKLAQVEELVKKHDIRYPVAMDMTAPWQAGYKAPVLPRVWIVGTEGKVIFAGRSGYDDALKKELAKVKYPGLGRHEVHESLQPAAEKYAAGEYGESYKLAEKVYDKTDSEKAEEDADYIMAHIDDRMSKLEVRAETAEIMRDYRLALLCWEVLATKFKGLDGAEEAPARLKKLRENPEVENEINAKRELLRRMMDLDVLFQDVDDEDEAAILEFRKKCLASYRQFVKEYPNTGAADKAQSLIEIFEELIGTEAESTD